MAESEKDEEQEYLVELECVELVSLSNVGKLGRSYGNKIRRRLQNICILFYYYYYYFFICSEFCHTLK